MIPYHKHSTQLLNMLDSINIGHLLLKMPISWPKRSQFCIGAKEIMTMPICNFWVVSLEDNEDDESSNVIHAYEVEKEDWIKLLLIFWFITSCQTSRNTRQKYEDVLQSSFIIKGNFTCVLSLNNG